jgi:stage V sporulation protein G
VANCIPGRNLRRLRFGFNVEGESVWLAASRHHLVHRRHRRLLCCHCPSRRIRAEGKIVRESHAPCGISDGGLNMQITEVRIRPANENLVKAYASICFDDCFLVYDIKVIQGPTGLFLSFPKKVRDGTYWDIAYPANAETRMMIQRVIGIREMD